MTRSTAGTTPSLQNEAAGAGNSNNPLTEQPQAPDNRAATKLSQRERSRTLLIGNIKQAVADMLLTTGEAAQLKNSDYLSRRLSHDYTYLANLFSEATGGTIEQYIIEYRVDRIKELIIAGELNLTQISYKCKYSSVAHLSNQFKKVTGLTPSAFKMLHIKRGIVPESVNDATKFCNYVSVLQVRRVSFAT
ncbi:MAG: helix-turn-helix domain-containing protein [Janthinobacterium lividum]